MDMDSTSLWPASASIYSSSYSCSLLLIIMMTEWIFPAHRPLTEDCWWKSVIRLNPADASQDSSSDKMAVDICLPMNCIPPKTIIHCVSDVLLLLPFVRSGMLTVLLWLVIECTCITPTCIWGHEKKPDDWISSGFPICDVCLIMIIPIDRSPVTMHDKWYMYSWMVSHCSIHMGILCYIITIPYCPLLRGSKFTVYLKIKTLLTMVMLL